jgi:hypothetical protein
VVPRPRHRDHGTIRPISWSWQWFRHLNYPYPFFMRGVPYNKPKRTPNHPTKSHVVVAKEGDKVKTIRFGQQGVTGDKKPTKRQASFKARHASNIKKGKMSAAYWANKVKWFRLVLICVCSTLV